MPGKSPFLYMYMALLALSPLAGALPAQASAPLEEIVVTAKHLSLDKLNAVKTPTPVLDVPQSLSIIPAEQLERQAFASVADLIRYTPGLAVSQGEGHRDAIIIRGHPTTADFFLDGLRDDVQYYRPLYNIDQVEILRGPNALLFGRGGGGGVINRVTKQPLIGEAASALSLGLDTLGAATLALDWNRGGDRHAFRMNAYHRSHASHRDFYEGDSYAVNPSFKWELGSSTTASLAYERVEDDRTVDRGVPSVARASGPAKPLVGYEDTFFGSPQANRASLRAHIIKARLAHDFNHALTGNVTLLHADYAKRYQNLYASDAVTLGPDGAIRAVELDGYRNVTDRQNLIIQANLIGEFQTGAVRHTLLFGAEQGAQDTANNRWDNVFNSNGQDKLRLPFTDPLTIPDFAIDKQVRDQRSEVEFASIYLQDQIAFGERFKLVLGARLDQFDISVLNGAADGSPGRFARKDDELSPRLGAIYKPVPQASIYLSYAETFLPRSGDQFLTLNLDAESTRPQTFANREAGVKWDFSDDLSLTFALFEQERESYLSTDPENPEQSIVIEGSQVTGFELQLTGSLTDRWSLTSGYSRLNGEVQRADGSGNDGNQTRQTPEQMLSLWNHIQLGPKFALGLGLTHQASFFPQEDNTVQVPAYIRLDASLHWRPTETVSLQLNIENLLDEAYYPDAHTNNNITPGAPLTARLSLKAAL